MCRREKQVRKHSSAGAGILERYIYATRFAWTMITTVSFVQGVLFLLASSSSPMPYRHHHHHRLCELTTGSTWHSVDALGHVREVGVEIGVESLGVGLDLRKREANSSVHGRTSRVVGQAGGEGSGHAADRHAVVLTRHGLWVGECKSWWAGHALDTSVNVRCGASGREVLATDVVEADVVADGLELRVDAKVVESHGARETAGEGVVRVDDLTGNSLHSVGAGEWDGEALGTLQEALRVTVL